MLLIRHFSNRPPYDDYARLTLDQLDAIATFRVDPSVNAFDAAALPEGLAGYLSPSSRVRCSPSVRTRETHALARNALGLRPAEPVIDERLKELWFRPSGFVAPHEHPLTAIRERLYDELFSGSEHVEPLAAVRERVDSLLDDETLVDAVCFTHGFFMRFVRAYVMARRDIHATQEMIQKVPPVGYLECFSLDPRQR